MLSFRAPPAALAGSRRPARLHVLREVWRGIVVRLVEVLVVRRRSPVTSIVRRHRSADLAIVARHFDAPFYLRQIRASARHARVARDPLLHYLLIGWRERRSPNPRLDPRYYRNDVCSDMLDREPLLHIAAQPDPSIVPQNEVEACAPPGAASAEPTTARYALVFHHARGGGSSDFLALFEAAMRRDGIHSRRLRLVTFSDRLVVWTHDDGRYETIDLGADAGRLTEIARDAGITHVIVNHFIDFHESMPDLASRLARDIGAPLWLLLHDYYAICPRINLVDADGRACRLERSRVCARCAPDRETGELWRRDNLAFLERADRLIVPSDDMRARMQRFTDAPIEVWTPEADVGYGPPRPPSLIPAEDLRVAILGSVNLAKGSEVVAGLAQRIRVRGAPVKITIIGYAENARQLQRLGVDLTGRYRPAELAATIKRSAPDVILLPFIWPETWSFALTNALKARLPVALFAHGAPAERLARLGYGELVMPIDWIDAPDKILDVLLDLRGRSMSSRSGVQDGADLVALRLAPYPAACYAPPGVGSGAVLDHSDRRISP